MGEIPSRGYLRPVFVLLHGIELEAGVLALEFQASEEPPGAALRSLWGGLRSLAVWSSGKNTNFGICQTRVCILAAPPPPLSMCLWEGLDLLISEMGMTTCGGQTRVGRAFAPLQTSGHP